MITVFSSITVPGQNDDLLDTPSRQSGDPAHLLGHERTGSANLAYHGAVLDGVHPYGRCIHAGRRRFKIPQPYGNPSQGHGRDRPLDDSFSRFRLGIAGDVHDNLTL